MPVRTYILLLLHISNQLCFVYTHVVCSSSSNISTKYDPDLLKSDVAHARERVTRLKRELEQIGVEMSCTRRGVETLSKYVLTIPMLLLKIKLE